MSASPIRDSMLLKSFETAADFVPDSRKAMAIPVPVNGDADASSGKTIFRNVNK